MATKLEIERKFLLRRLPENLKYQNVLEITQFYLKDGSRIRETRDVVNDLKTNKFNIKYELTRKNKLKPGVYEESERTISKKKFKKLREKATSVISKVRYVHKMGKLKWEIDKYKGIEMVTAEIEIPDQYAGFKMPAAVSNEVIMDVTEFPQFTNRSLSLKTND